MFRIGIGYDIHRFSSEPCESIVVGGIQIPYNRKIIAHSDGDIVLHAITDAILGAIAEGSIGMHFPNTDEKWRGAKSSAFVQYSSDLMMQKGYKINNIDITVISHEPKIMPYAVDIRKEITRLLDIAMDQVNIKAVTPERLGALGRKEGIACQTAVLLIKR